LDNHTIQEQEDVYAQPVKAMTNQVEDVFAHQDNHMTQSETNATAQEVNHSMRDREDAYAQPVKA